MVAIALADLDHAIYHAAFELFYRLQTERYSAHWHELGFYTDVLFAYPYLDDSKCDWHVDWEMWKS